MKKYFCLALLCVFCKYTQSATLIFLHNLFLTCIKVLIKTRVDLNKLFRKQLQVFCQEQFRIFNCFFWCCKSQPLKMAKIYFSILEQDELL